MKSVKFEWDEAKNKVNIQKHSVDFEEAKTVFYDDHAVVITDLKHSETEERFLIMGISQRLRVLIVCYCIREPGPVIRIITARKATRAEEKQYEDWNGELDG